MLNGSACSRYFRSRPDLLANVGAGSADTATSNSAAGGAAASAVHRALASNPEATSKLVSAGLKHGIPKNSPYAAAVSKLIE
jgi:abl interactor 2